MFHWSTLISSIFFEDWSLTVNKKRCVTQGRRRTSSRQRAFTLLFLPEISTSPNSKPQTRGGRGGRGESGESGKEGEGGEGEERVGRVARKGREGRERREWGEWQGKVGNQGRGESGESGEEGEGGEGEERVGESGKEGEGGERTDDFWRSSTNILHLELRKVLCLRCVVFVGSV